MARCNLCVVAVLFLALNVFCEQAAAAGCCYSYSIKPLHCSRIRGYTIQTTKDACNIDAIVFHSIGNRNICANPLDKWVMDRIECLNRRVDNINGRTRK
ncbi:C-C motif chemokine 20-like [Acipenser ruthenus]|uniref:C-C motif chemokine 20-like n=1 Tax=Acipenser ruthenus TaxID=7906 RepID=UPI0015604318|nr:C-C motif chemokine 20-like [Acipenser ruthenus]